MVLPGRTDGRAPPDSGTGTPRDPLPYQTNADESSDITFETAAADYSTLQIVDRPPTGGDTLWASGYELYDRLSPPFQRFYESLTATYAQPGFTKAAANGGFEVYSNARGSPLNVGSELSSVHPGN